MQVSRNFSLNLKNSNLNRLKLCILVQLLYFRFGLTQGIEWYALHINSHLTKVINIGPFCRAIYNLYLISGAWNNSRQILILDNICLDKSPLPRNNSFALFHCLDKNKIICKEQARRICKKEKLQMQENLQITRNCN